MRYCFVIPNYNHLENIDTLFDELVAFKWPIIMVNDASDERVKATLIDVSSSFDDVTLLHHNTNQGKGGAVQTGLKYAYQQGYDYAIQVDADGQHCLNDVSKLVSLSKQYPDSVISGKPVYDSSVPKHRYWARYITHFWVMVETLSTQLKDTMCGYRVYPLKPCYQLMSTNRLGKRMDFDIEILVRLFWQGVDVRFIDTKVIYPEHGVSHFRALEDNLRISWLHTRLCLGMVIRSPQLILRKLK